MMTETIQGRTVHVPITVDMTLLLLLETITIVNLEIPEVLEVHQFILMMLCGMGTNAMVPETIVVLTLTFLGFTDNWLDL